MLCQLLSICEYLKSQEMSSSFKYLVVKIQNKDDGKLRNVVALNQWHESYKQKCGFPSMEQMEYLDLQKILKSSCSPQKSWPANQVLEVYNQTGMVNINIMCKMNDTDVGKKRTRKLPAKFHDEQH